MDEAHDGTEPDHSLRDLRECFIIHEQASAELPRSEGLFDAPPFGQQDKAFGKFWAPDDLNGHSQAYHRRLELPGIGALSDNSSDPGKQRSSSADQVDATIAVRCRGVGHAHGQQVTTAVDQDVALAAADLVWRCLFSPNNGQQVASTFLAR